MALSLDSKEVMAFPQVEIRGGEDMIVYIEK
jgi:hypothetical protein